MVAATAKLQQERSGGRGGPCAGCDGGADAVAHEREIAHGVVAAREMHVDLRACILPEHVAALHTTAKFGFDTTICQLCFFYLKIFENGEIPKPP